MPELRITLDQSEYKELWELKDMQHKTWKELLKANLTDNKEDEVKELIYDKYEEIKKCIGAFGYYDLLEIIEIFRALTLRSIKNGVNKKELIERMSELLELDSESMGEE